MKTRISDRTAAMEQSEAPQADAGRRPSAREACLFLAAYSARLLGCGATCIRLEKNVGRMAAAFGKEAEITIMPRHVHITVNERGSDSTFTSSATVAPAAINFNINTRLSELSWEVADTGISFEATKERFEDIAATAQENRYAVLALVTLANAAFCRLFGGDAAAMAVVAAATLAGFMLKQELLARKADARMVTMLCAFVSSVLGATAVLFGLGDTPLTAMGTSVLYLVPGIPFLNSFSDMLCRHYICAFCRFADATVLTCCLSAGLCAGMLMMGVGMF